MTASPRARSLSIADAGRGIAPEGLATLFQPFKRLAPTADIPGTGLSLVVVRLLVEQMNGRIEVASEPGLGACFMRLAAQGLKPACLSGYLHCTQSN